MLLLLLLLTFGNLDERSIGGSAGGRNSLDVMTPSGNS